MVEKKFQKSLSLLAWAYNEEENVDPFIEESLANLEAVCDDYELVLVDDGSTDRTAELITAWTRKNPRVRLVRHKVNMNIGYAIPTAIHAATKEFLFWNTFDNSYDTKNLWERVQWLDRFDIVQCVRLKGKSDNGIKLFISRVNYWLLRLLSGIPLTDFQNCTFHRTKSVQAIDFEARSALTNPEMIIKLYHQGARIKELPITFTPRERGEAKGTKPGILLKSILDVFVWVPRWRLRALFSGGRRGSVDRAK